MLSYALDDERIPRASPPHLGALSNENLASLRCFAWYQVSDQSWNQWPRLQAKPSQTPQTPQAVS
jgi:hypothetical protein